MQRDLVKKNLNSSFLNVEKDTLRIIRKLFVESRPYSDILKALLVVNGNDVLKNMKNPVYNQAIQQATPTWLNDNDSILTVPTINIHEFDEKKSFLLITFDNFTPNETNPQFRDCIVTIDIICHLDLWDLGDYQLRPLKIAGYVDGILDNTHLTGIGTFQFLGGGMLKFNEQLAGYSLMYRAVHGSDDKIPDEG